MNTFKLKVLATLMITSLTSGAVNINPKGTGQVLIYPYYTVNNDLNTFYSVVNTTADTKAIKISFREGDISKAVLSFNVYLAPYDVWTGQLSATTSSIPGHVGEPSVIHASADLSCTPFFNTVAQEFLPFEIESDVGNNSLQRSTEGHLEVIEMGTITGPSEQAIWHDNNGVPNDCDQIQDAWNNGYWSQDTSVDMLSATGGLIGSVTLLNVLEGFAVGYDAIALDGFWQNNEAHTEPGSLTPNLGNAFPQSKILDNGLLQALSWNTGADAVSAVLMQQILFNEFNLQTFVNTKSEWVISYPTKYLHADNNPSQLRPFTRSWDGTTACEDVAIKVWDASEQDEPKRFHSSCFSVNVAEFKAAGSPNQATTNLLGSENFFVVAASDNNNATEFGWAKLDLDTGNQRFSNPSGFTYLGLPATGFLIQKYSNAGAGPGILAQYGNLHPHKLQSMSLGDLIFADGFENP